jgi:exonuclease III
MMVSHQHNSNVIKVLLWNTNGIKQNEAEFLNLLQEKHIDLALILETHCKPCSKLFFLGYMVYRTDQPNKTAHAGSAIIISSKIKHYLLPTNQTPTIQATNIQLTLNHIPIKISSVYIPPYPAINSKQLEDFFKSLGQKFIIGGDLNAKHSQWGCISDNSRGKILQKTINNNNYTHISPNGPTYWPTSK